MLASNVCQHGSPYNQKCHQYFSHFLLDWLSTWSVLTLSLNLKSFTFRAKKRADIFTLFTHIPSVLVHFTYSKPTWPQNHLCCAACWCIWWVKKHPLPSRWARCFCMSLHSSYCGCQKWPRQKAIPWLRDEVVSPLSRVVFLLHAMRFPSVWHCTGWPTSHLTLRSRTLSTRRSVCCPNCNLFFLLSLSSCCCGAL